MRDMEMVPSERSGLLAWMLARGDTFTAKEASALVECHEDTARRILNRLSRVLPIYEDDGVFQALRTDEEEVAVCHIGDRHPYERFGVHVPGHRTPVQRR